MQTPTPYLGGLGAKRCGDRRGQVGCARHLRRYPGDPSAHGTSNCELNMTISRVTSHGLTRTSTSTTDIDSNNAVLSEIVVEVSQWSATTLRGGWLKVSRVSWRPQQAATAAWNSFLR